MTDDLLNKEREFRRINKELDKKTNELFKEVELIINSSNNHLTTKSLLSTGFSKFYNLSNDLNSFDSQQSFDSDSFHTRNKNNTPNIRLKDNCSNSNINNEDKINIRNEAIPLIDDDFFSTENNSVKSNETIIKFLKAKVKVLVNDLDTVKNELKKKDNLIKDLQNENTKINESKDKLNNQIINLKSTISKLENTISTQQMELQARLNESCSLKKDIEVIKKELKHANQQISSLDLRLNRSVEDNEKLKNNIKSNKVEERSLRDKIRKLEDSERLVVKNYERQFSEILQAFRKQSLLIDNLKKQKAYLEASKQINLTREDFLKILKLEV
ncbi:uncharacterized protein DDB_G0283697 [Chelonus insularis]|uniref:uncharacterized protein DDB_G0283697 n=1 Tax=Chelonus insularis TaxID=460826 RepID=UPI00158F438B|nr:uncharacterized protein DDB_G0283697-like [Chelonus insularis]